MPQEQEPPARNGSEAEVFELLAACLSADTRQALKLLPRSEQLAFATDPSALRILDAMEQNFTAARLGEQRLEASAQLPDPRLRHFLGHYSVMDIAKEQFGSWRDVLDRHVNDRIAEIHRQSSRRAGPGSPSSTALTEPFAATSTALTEPFAAMRIQGGDRLPRQSQLAPPPGFDESTPRQHSHQGRRR
ncbi:hypothetical protein [Micromonospora sp. SH-82]|uniref:hypothetical protein n=1 Tax=Micromonospora sp. SH-82 TaxID=3132938 RepID=UPI003EC0F04F